MQTRRQIFLESTVNTVASYLVGIAAGQWLIFPLYDMHPTLLQNAEIGIWFALISMARNWLCRWMFNR